MLILILLPLLFIFLYCLYRLIKDDYVFIRRNISLEQSFDIALGVICLSLIISRFFYLFFHAEKSKNIFVSFFSANSSSFSLIGALIGGLFALYLLGKYKRVPLGRMFDFFTLAFSVVLPIGFLLASFFVKDKVLPLHFLTVGVYFLLTVVFWKFIYPKLINRTIKDGALTNLFFMFFIVVSLLISLVGFFSHVGTFFTIQNGFWGALFIFNSVLLIKQERNSTRGRRPAKG
jgi:hypothetical protein